MKKFSTIAVTVAAATLALTGCLKDRPGPENKKAIQFSSSISGHQGTRASGATWGETDEIGVYMIPAGATDFSTAHKANAQYRHDGGGTGNFSHVGEANALYYPGEAVNVTFVAYYPYDRGIHENGHIYNINVGNQTDHPAIDLMVSDRKTQSTGNVQLNFKHKLAKVIFNVTDEDTSAVLAGMTTVITTMKSTATYDLATGAYAMTGTEGPITARYASGSANVARAEAIVLPGTHTFNVNFTLANGDVVSFKAPITATYEEGKVYTYPVTIPVTPKEAVLIRGCDITDWIEGTVTTDYEVEKTPGVVTPDPAIDETTFMSDFDGLTEIPAAAANFAITFDITDPVQGGVLSFEGTSEWITVTEVVAGGARRAANKSVGLDAAVQANTGAARNGAIVIKYNGKTLKTIEFTQAAGLPEGNFIFRKVATAPVDFSGQYLIVCETAKMALNERGSNSYFGGADVTAFYNDVDATIAYNATTAGYVCNIEAVESVYTIKRNDEYLGLTSNNNNLNGSTTGSGANYQWSITVDESGNADIVPQGFNTRKIRWNTQSPRFACYASGQTAIQLYILANE